MVYLDSSAAVKLAHQEDHSEALAAWLSARSDLAMVSSVLVEIELNRALHRYDPAAIPAVAQVLARLHRVELTAEIRAMAGAYTDGRLRSLDAIHLATAQFVAQSGDGAPQVFVGYDARLLAAARARNMDVAAPGLP
jgi:hypothetical protein